MIGQQVYSFALRPREGAIPTARFSMDKWDGYVAARQRLYNRLRRNQGAEPDRPCPATCTSTTAPI